MGLVLKIYTDGASRGNPGPSACAFVIFANGEKLAEKSFFLGKKTNNESEYEAILRALKFLESKNFIKRLRRIYFYSDSELVVKQLKGIYKIREKRLARYAVLIKSFQNKLKIPINFFLIKRNKNFKADNLVNQELDKSLG